MGTLSTDGLQRYYFSFAHEEKPRKRKVTGVSKQTKTFPNENKKCGGGGGEHFHIHTFVSTLLRPMIMCVDTGRMEIGQRKNMRGRVDGEGKTGRWSFLTQFSPNVLCFKF